MLRSRRFAVYLVVLMGARLSLSAQVAPQQTPPAPAQSAARDNVPRVPGVSTVFRGVNGGVTYSGIHNSSIGWYEAIAPALSFTFSAHFSADVSGLIYAHRLVDLPAPGTTRPPSSTTLVGYVNAPGDTLIGLHASWKLGALDDTATASLTAPSGNRSEGLGTGRVTFDFDNRAERFVRQAGFLLDLGAGDSSTLFNNLVLENYSTLGPLAHFETGAALWFWGSNSIQSVAYEELPFGGQKVFSGQGPPGSPNATVITSNSASEDNGFTTTVSVPLDPHVLLLSYYNRSLRHHQDTVSVGVTFVMRGMSLRKRLSMVDKALREAAAPAQ